MIESRDDILTIALPTPFPIGPVNVYLLEGEPLTLVDSGPRTAEALAALEAALAARGHRVEDLGLVLLTHEHLDHAGMAAALAARSGAEVAAATAAVPYLRNLHDEGQRLGLFAEEFMLANGAPAAPERPAGLFAQLGDPLESCRGLEDGELVAAGGRQLRVHHRPGHSRFDLLFEDEREALAFGGDHLLAEAPTTALPFPAGPGRTAPAPALLTYRHSLAQTRSLGLSELEPGHGPPVRDPGATAGRRLAAIGERARRLLRLLEREGELSAYEAVVRLKGKSARAPGFAAVADVRSYLDLLAADGAAERHERGGTVCFSSTPEGGTDGV